jgi:hypothetical protein
MLKPFIIREKWIWPSSLLAWRVFCLVSQGELYLMFVFGRSFLQPVLLLSSILGRWGLGMNSWNWIQFPLSNLKLCKCPRPLIIHNYYVCNIKTYTYTFLSTKVGISVNRHLFNANGLILGGKNQVISSQHKHVVCVDMKANMPINLSNLFVKVKYCSATDCQIFQFHVLESHKWRVIFWSSGEATRIYEIYLQAHST